MRIPKLIQMVKIAKKDMVNRVRIYGVLSDRFAVRNGLRQEDPLSKILFNLILEKIYVNG